MFQYVHHVHYVVENLDAMMEYLEKIFGMKPDHRFEDPHHGKVVHYNVGKTQIQIAEPTDPSSGVGKFLAKNGPGVFHVAWGIDHIQEAVQELAARGAKMKKSPLRPDDEGDVGANTLGTLVCNIDPASSHGILFQLVGGA